MFQIPGKVVIVGLLLGLMVPSEQLAAQTLPTKAIAMLPVAARRAYYQTAFEQRAAQLYTVLGLGQSGLPLKVFREGLVGYYNLRPAGKPTASPPVLTLIDFSISSQQKRLWVINVEKAKVLYHTLVAHGKASGADVPLAFSNKGGSEMSSLGFYRTAPTTYTGKHGLSLKLVGLDPGFNTNAESRAVVVHGAEYVCQDFVKTHGRLGRSQGCPALPVAETAAIVKAIKGGSVLYLHGPERANYHSRWLNLDTAVAAYSGVY
ncbi:murein L,D-transpeptidase catalytic domain family protein [Hymenobacter sp. BT770]|uniref:murein L,D-transpeptidase catalytic domain family protein n=1 Tax=Hymenobacter sp. BT770 TaxID=2886942 RepID=UPI001D12941A|nr:murein L,D-transpeptidase catalytic domain family protein [Hymenobacter sp. BT770]MCC3152561.1 murein L,D-transpeptidase catalytic domain family protein [Hymenobacter sp. BT770]MDO3414462.1 murein L,D-transpeptidase catalytic domain family protein [Hymenobacter sp. BT770]